jgi:hypothetical protein
MNFYAIYLINIMSNSLPYSQAVLTESIRHAGVAPLAPPRAPSNDTTFRGYKIPKVFHLTFLVYKPLKNILGLFRDSQSTQRAYG